MNQETSLYEILDLAPTASPQEIREAYLKTKSAYNKDSIALYSLITAEEREEVLRKVEQAYEVLSHPEQRKAYDRAEGLAPPANAPGSPPSPMSPAHDRAPSNVVSIDRVPPMDVAFPDEDLLVAPVTDFTLPRPSAEAAARPESPALPADPETSLDNPELSRRSIKGAEASLARDISEQTEWRGEFLRRVREGRRISIEEMAAMTKVSKTYLVAIEEENYPKLPAAVFLRGFVAQIAKLLKLPHEQVTTAYMNRYFASKQGSTS